MKILPLPALALCVFLFACAALHFAPAANAAPVPVGMDARAAAILTKEHSPDAVVPPFLNIPYRDDGVVNDQGSYAQFQHPTTILPSPGLNCSGFVLSASRFLLRSNISTATAMRDRLGDSGPTSPMGEDWDFGWDIILNISDGLQRNLLLPGGKTADPTRLTGKERGFDLHAPATMQELPARMRPGYLYLFSFSKPVTRKGYTFLHYHVGLAWANAAGEIWYYHSTPSGNGVNKRNLATVDGRASFLRAFTNTGNTRKMAVVLEVALPK